MRRNGKYITSNPQSRQASNSFSTFHRHLGHLQSAGQSDLNAFCVSSFHSLTKRLISLNSTISASPIHSYNHPSLVVTTTPSALNRSSATLTSSLLQLLTPSANTYALCPPASKSKHVCVTQMCDSIPTMTGVKVRSGKWA